MKIDEKLLLIAELLEEDSVSEETPLADCEYWDSMSALSLIAMLEEEFGRTDIGSQQVDELKTVADILELMTS